MVALVLMLLLTKQEVLFMEVHPAPMQHVISQEQLMPVQKPE